jgi:hypothetical protein
MTTPLLTTGQFYPMERDEATACLVSPGNQSGKNKYYSYEVKVFVPKTVKSRDDFSD